MSTTVIIGGVAGGMSTATRLRRNDENMNIIVLESSGYVSFANCGLPYFIGGEITKRSNLLLQTPQSLKARFNLDVRTGSTATHINRAEKTVTVDGPEGTYELNYDNLVLSPGARPLTPPIPGIDKAFTLRTVEDTDRIVHTISTTEAKKAVVIGGGFIGLELAENLIKQGIDVTIVERAPHIMAPLDAEMAAIVTAHLEKSGVTILSNTQVTAIEDGVVHAGERKIPADTIIAALGVQPASDLAQQAGLELNEHGGIVVNSRQQTSDPAIFALGDAAQKTDAISGTATMVPLAQTANRHGRLVADIITGRNTEAQPVLGTAIIGLFGLAIATTGWNERRARAEDKNVRVIHSHPANHAGYYPGATSLNLKLIVDAEDDSILGAQAIGHDGVDKRIDIIATAMRARLKASDLADLELAYAPQFGSAKDPINMLGFINDNIIRGERTVQWHELDTTLQEGWTLVDVRTPSEYDRGSIPNAINIPVDELRDRLSELDGKKVLVHCQVGLRGHIACTLLSNNGIECANLDGGYITWKFGQATRS
ncbi:FAD-dependent oxidoreductase [Arcanobacterium phocisimile]|uniref:FAD-dependent oxidoreductase n=1 Tax=Arcanobacterium phocisimile TaxID=1302235 RepID=A0ABX7IFY9_9ACTO|nr:FAD-dependent oxidoreductase [Arcanobacterium phocisimile]QRV02046.1 FAD-dependent oxidoreductase [Arcanobacterium phocisimile]